MDEGLWGGYLGCSQVGWARVEDQPQLNPILSGDGKQHPLLIGVWVRLDYQNLNLQKMKKNPMKNFIPNKFINNFQQSKSTDTPPNQKFIVVHNTQSTIAKIPNTATHHTKESQTTRVEGHNSKEPQLSPDWVVGLSLQGYRCSSI